MNCRVQKSFGLEWKSISNFLTASRSKSLKTESITLADPRIGALNTWLSHSSSFYG